MTLNIGCLDRIVRVILGTALLTSFYFTKNYWFALGLIPLLTGLIGNCPFYCLLKINTCSLKK